MKKLHRDGVLFEAMETIPEGVHESEAEDAKKHW